MCATRVGGGSWLASSVPLREHPGIVPSAASGPTHMAVHSWLASICREKADTWHTHRGAVRTPRARREVGRAGRRETDTSMGDGYQKRMAAVHPEPSGGTDADARSMVVTVPMRALVRAGPNGGAAELARLLRKGTAHWFDRGSPLCLPDGSRRPGVFLAYGSPLGVTTALWEVRDAFGNIVAEATHEGAALDERDRIIREAGHEEAVKAESERNERRLREAAAEVAAGTNLTVEEAAARLRPNFGGSALYPMPNLRWDSTDALELAQVFPGIRRVMMVFPGDGCIH